MMFGWISRSTSQRAVVATCSMPYHNSASQFMLLSLSKACSNSVEIVQRFKFFGGGRSTYSTSIPSFSATITSVPMPSLSPTMTHGTISAWLKKPGDDLHAGDVLCDIETDKASVGFEIQEESVLAKILINALGPESPCGDTICLTVEDQEAYAEFLKMDPASYSSPSASAPASAPVAGAAAIIQVAVSAPVHPIEEVSSENQRFSPAARHMLESKSMDPRSIKGTSKGGRVSKEDVILAIKAGVAVAGSAPKHEAPKAAITPLIVAPVAVQVSAAAVPFPSAAMSPQSIDFTTEAPANSRYTDIVNTNMRKIIAKRLTESKATVPHFYTSIECEIDDLMALRKTMKKDLDVNVSVNDLVLRSAALALRDVPEANAKWNRQTGVIDMSSAVDISVAVATPNGLITPIVTGADKRGLSSINKAVKDLAGRAKEGKLKPEEFQGGSFSVSNLGMFGISSFSAVVNPPQACILAVGAGISRIAPPKAPGGKPRVVTTVTVQLSGDRRVVDEALAAQFLQVFRSYLSNPKSMLL